MARSERRVVAAVAWPVGGQAVRGEESGEESGEETLVYVYCDDGTVWRHFAELDRWEEMSPMPSSRRATEKAGEVRNPL